MNWLDHIVQIEGTPYASLPLFLTSLGIGLMLGVERERKANARAGIRTFSLTSMFGTLSAMLASRTGEPAVLIGGLAVMAVFILSAYWRFSHDDGPDVTTQVALVFGYGLGAMVWYDMGEMAVALGLIATLLLYLKPELSGFSQRLSRHDLMTLLQFGAVTGIILPILPDQSFGPYAALNLRETWLMVVLISGVGLTGYLAVMLIGEKAGAPLMGVMGGLTSTTATSMIYARQVKESPENLNFCASVILLANLVVFFRMGVVAAVVAPAILPMLLPVLAAGLLCGLAVLLYQRWRRPVGSASVSADFQLKNPTELHTALLFGAIYALVTLAVAWLTDLFGNGGLYLVALISGLTDIDAIALATLRQFAGGKLDALLVAAAFAIATASNAAFKFSLIAGIGGAALARRIAPAFIAMALGMFAVLPLL